MNKTVLAPNLTTMALVSKSTSFSPGLLRCMHFQVVTVVISPLFSNSSNAVHNFGSSKSLITKEAPASTNDFSGFLKPMPTTGIPAATPAFTPETESFQNKNKTQNTKKNKSHLSRSTQVMQEFMQSTQFREPNLNHESVLRRHFKHLESPQVGVRKWFLPFTVICKDNNFKEIREPHG